MSQAHGQASQIWSFEQQDNAVSPISLISCFFEMSDAVG
jgi:hypothetical protein